MDTVIDSFVKQSEEILKDNLVGIYLHGSAVMGCFNPTKSDLDLIVVVREPMTDADKRSFMDMVVELSNKGPAKGIEMSVVRQNVCQPFVYPTPFELHFSVGHIDWYRNDPEDYISKMKGEDKDLAAHFTIINHRGKCLCGAPIKDIFADVPVWDYIDSIWNDIADAENEIMDNPMYIILNLTRVLAYIKDGLVLSKKEGGEWALGNIPGIYHALLQNALKEYAEGKDSAYDMNLEKDYAKYMVEQVRCEMERVNLQYIDCGIEKDRYWFRYRTGAIIVRDNKMLFVKSKFGGYYYMIGGGVHLGEDSKSCIERETFEETGVKCTARRIAIICENFFCGVGGTIEGKECHVLEYYYLMDAPEDSLFEEATDADEKLEWVSLDELINNDIRPAFLKTELKGVIEGGPLIHVINDERNL